MSYSLRLTHGDFATRGAQLSTVTNAEKLVQDLRCCVLEHMGTDEAHLDYGSVIDGGRLPDGTLVGGLIGSPNDPGAASALEAELRRITTAYRAQQLARAKNDRSVYSRVTLTPGEVLLGLTGLDIVQQEDQLLAIVTLQTAAGPQILQFPVDS